MNPYNTWSLLYFNTRLHQYMTEFIHIHMGQIVQYIFYQLPNSLLLYHNFETF